VLFNWFNKSKQILLENDELLLRSLQKKDYLQWEHVRSNSKDFLTPFEPRWGEKSLSKQNFLRRIRYFNRQAALGQGFSFSIWKKTNAAQVLVGGLSLTNIRHLSGHVNLGYWVGESDKNKGIMSLAVALTLPFIFNSLGLCRIHAACLPSNIASRKVLEKNGFCEEGFAKNYLQIDGVWQDHVLYALTLEEYRDGNINEAS